MKMRLVHRLCHFVIYAVLFLIRQLKFKLQRLYNSLLWIALLALNRMDEERTLQNYCVTGALLGSKKLTHATLIVNELHKDVNRPTRDQVDRLADVIMWLMISLDGSDQKTQVTVYDKTGRLIALADLVHAMLKVRLAARIEMPTAPATNTDDVSKYPRILT